MQLTANIEGCTQLPSVIDGPVQLTGYQLTVLQTAEVLNGTAYTSGTVQSSHLIQIVLLSEVSISCSTVLVIVV